MNIPCQVCYVTSTTGEVKPLWCEFKNEEGEIVKLTIISVKPAGVGSIHARFYECTAEAESGTSCLFKLSFDPGTQKWAIVGKKF